MAEQEQQAEKEQKPHGGGGHGPRGGGHEEAHEGAPEWIISFADNVALLMGFFVILLAFSMADKSAGRYTGEGPAARPGAPDFLDAVIGIRDAFHNPVSLNSTNPEEQALIQRVLQRRGEVPVEQEGPRGQKYRMQSIRPSKYYNLCGSVPFDDQSCVLNEAGKEAVSGILEHLRGLRLIVSIRGHVSAAEAFGTADHGLRLSFDRALAVATMLNESGLDWRQIRVMACGDNDRVEPVAYAPNDQGTNQRVEVLLSEELMPDYTPSTASPAEKPGQ